jgi:Fe-Mn family superoxide dismutase
MASKLVCVVAFIGAVHAFVPVTSRPLRSTVLAAVALPPLPYPYTDLEPFIGKQTLEIHHDKHHAKYVSVTNEMIAGTEMEHDDLATIVMKSSGKNQGLFNNAAQSWNHAFYWECMKKGGGGAPSGKLAEHITKDFGSFDAFKKEFVTAGNTAFGSGWAWLSFDPKAKKLVVTKTIGAGTPVTDGLTPLLTMDVWEHAYYLDYQNLRAKYSDTFMDKLVNWDFVAANFAKC